MHNILLQQIGVGKIIARLSNDYTCDAKQDSE